MPESRSAATPRAPRQRVSAAPSHHIARLAIEAMQDKKAVDVVVIDVRKVSGVTNYYVVCTGQSDVQIRAIVDSIQEKLREELGERPWKREGTEHLQWVVLDYVDVVVHVFDRERREFYDIERLWGDAPSEQVDEDAEEVTLLSDDHAHGS